MSYETPILTAGGASNQTIREAVTTPRHDVGTRAQTSDGRVFYYSRTSDSNVLAAGQLVMSEVIIANHANIAVSSAAAVGATSVAVTLGGSESLVKDAYQGGYLVVNDVDGEGRTYRIAGNAATSSTTAATLDLSDEIETALTTNSQVTILKNPWMDVVEAAAGHVHFVCGVPQFAVPAGDTDAQYFWAQTWGVSALEDDAATAIGAVLQSGTTAGQVEVGDGAAQPIGVQLFTGVATEYYPKFLTIAP